MAAFLPYALIIAVIVSFALGTIFNFNVGLLCIVTGFIALVVCGGTGAEIISVLSTSTIALMVGIMFMFTIANKNGTIEKLCNKMLRTVHGKSFLMPFAFAIVGAIVCGTGAGGMATCALMCNPAAGMSKKVKVDPLLMSTTTMHGTFMGQFTPVSAMAVPVLAYLQEAGIDGLEFKIMGWNLALEFVAVVVAFIIFGGLKLVKSKDSITIDLGEIDDTFNVQNWISLACIVLLLVAIIFTELNLGILALTLGFIMLLVSRKHGMDDGSIIKAMPWNSIVMIVGAMALMTLMADSGGTELIVGAIQSLNLGTFGLLILFLVAGLMSFYATSIPVVLAILPLAIQLCNVLGTDGIIPGVVVAICIVATIVDVSPMSNNGGMMLSSAAALIDDSTAVSKMFKKLFYYGLTQIVLWSVICWLLFVVIGL